ncbi:MAG: hypothetical protein GVY29_11340 [Spirochaetes bacterium]|nr:hypothetical protein [Spirochaetota bacterium]
MNGSNASRNTVFAILFFGGIWGVLEATLGFLLHFLPRVTGFPRLAGFLMFPIGLIFLVAAAQATRKPASALGVAAVAAAVKLSSLALPVVQWGFVRNPALAILSEGLIVFVGLYVVGFTKISARSVAAAIGVSLGWRGVFLLANVVLRTHAVRVCGRRRERGPHRHIHGKRYPCLVYE